MAQFYDTWRSGGTGRGTYTLTPRATDEIPLTIDLLAGQSVAGFRVRNSAGGILFSIDQDGNVTISGSISAVINETVTGDLTLTGNLTVVGNSVLGDAVGDTLTVNATSTFVNPVSMASTLAIAGITTTQSLISTTRLGLRRRGAAPAPIGVQGQLYTRAGDADTTELFYLDPAGNDVQITDAGALEGASLFWDDDEYIRMGNTAASPDVRMGWNTTQTVDAWYFGTSDAQNVLLIAENGDRAFDFAHGAQTNPFLFIHSASQSTTQWIGLSHNQTNGIIQTGTGDLLLDISGGNLAPTTNGGSSLGISGGNTFANLYLASGGSIDFGGGDVVIANASNQISIGGALIHNINQANGTTGLPTALTVNGGTHTGLTAATEDIGVNFNFSATKTWAAGAGPLATHREILIQAPTYAGDAGGALTITDAYTLYVNGGPTQGANMTLTRSWAAGFLGNVGFAAGTKTLPSIAFNLDPDTGIFNGAANTLNFTTAGGQRIGLSATAATFVVPLWSSDGVATSLTLQNQTFTSGVAHNAVTISPTWTAENFNHYALNIAATQNGANTQYLAGLNITLAKATAATELTSAAGIQINNLTLTAGTVANQYGLLINSLSGASNNYGIYSGANSHYFVIGAGHSITFDAGSTDHTGANVLMMDLDVNSASVNGFNFDVDVGTALSAGEIVNGIYIDIEGNAADDATAIINGIAITSTNATGGISRGLSILGAWDTAIRTAGGSIGFNLDASNFVNIDARAVDHTAATVLNMTVDVNSASVNAINVDIDVPTALSAGEIANGIAIDVDGNAGDNATSQINGLALTSVGTTGGTNTGIRMNGYWDTGVLISRSVNFTGVDTETSIDLNIAPIFTLTEPAGGLYTLFGANIDLSGISVTAGVGTSILAALRLVANADADVGTNYALFVDAGLSRFDGLLSWETTATGTGTAITATQYQIGRDADATNQMHFNVPTGAGFEFSVNDVAVSTMTSDGQTWILPATGTLTIDAGTTTDHTSANVITMDLDVNSASVNAFNFDIDVGTALSLAETVNGLNIDIDGLAGDHAGSAMNGINITSANNTGGVNSAINITGTWDYGIVMSGTPLMFDLNMNATTFINNTGVIDLVRSGNFTGVDTQTSIDFNIAPSFTLTEPAGGTFTLYGANIDLSGIAVTAGAGTSTLAALRLVANADADVGLNLALLVDSGQSRFDGQTAISMGANPDNAIVLSVGWNGNTMATGTTAARHFQTSGNITELANVAITDIVGAYFNSFTITDGGGTETVSTVATVYINNAPTVGTTPTNGPYSLFIDAGAIRIDDQIQWGAGTAVTAGNYSVGRDADATNQLHFNVPTGATFEWSINDVAEMTLSATAVNFQNNSITTTGGGSLTGTWTDLGIVTTVDINGGTLDGVIIGGASAAAATVTTLSMNNLITWSAGAAITAGNYQVGRDADGTNQLHLNVPTGATMEFSVNDVAVWTSGASVITTTANTDVNMSAGGRIYGGGVQINSQTLGANTNLTMDENDGHIDITSGAVSANVITLPAASGNQGMIVSFYLEVDGGQNANIQRAGADVIQNGSADLANTQVALDDAGDYLMLQCVSASMWQIIVNNGGTVT